MWGCPSRALLVTSPLPSHLQISPLPQESLHSFIFGLCPFLLPGHSFLLFLVFSHFCIIILLFSYK